MAERGGGGSRPPVKTFFAWTAGYEATIIICAAYIAISAERVYSVIAIAVAPLQQVSEFSAILNFVHSLSFPHPEPPSRTHPQGRCAAVTRRLHRVNPPNSDHVPPPLCSTALHVQKPTRTASLDFGSAGHLHHSAGLH